MTACVIHYRPKRILLQPGYHGTRMALSMHAVVETLTDAVQINPGKIISDLVI